MPLIGGSRIPFALENMSQMTAAIRAHNLCPCHPKCIISMPSNGAWNSVKICRPSATRFELMVGLVEGRFAAGAGVDTRFRHVLVVFPAKGSLSTLFSQNSELLYFRRCVNNRLLGGLTGLVYEPLLSAACHSSLLFCTG